MKTRLEKQIEEATLKLNALIAFAAEQETRYTADVAIINSVLAKYKTSIVNPHKNTFVDEMKDFNTGLIFRVYAEYNAKSLSMLQRNRIVSLLKAKGIPVVFVGLNNIELCYMEGK